MTVVIYDDEGKFLRCYYNVVQFLYDYRYKTLNICGLNNENKETYLFELNNIKFFKTTI